MYQLNPLFEGSVSVQMLMTTKKALNNAKSKYAYHSKMARVFADKMSDIVEKDGALMDRVVFSSLKKSQKHHIRRMDMLQVTIDNLSDKLTDIRLSMGLIR